MHTRRDECGARRLDETDVSDQAALIECTVPH